MNTPYKYVILSTPRSMSYWLAEFLGFDHDASTTYKDGKWEQKSEGLVDTGIYRHRDIMGSMVDSDTKFGILLRDKDSLALSLQKNFGLSEVQAKMMAGKQVDDLLKVHRSLEILQRSPIVVGQYPIRLQNLRRPLRILGIEWDEEKVKKALDEKRDKLDDPAYRIQCLEMLGQIFNLPQQ